jgi:uracil phosphoribosyltransferase
MHSGMLNYFDHAESAFVAAYRRHHKGGDFESEVEYTSSPNLDDKVVIISDPMLATGASIEIVYKQLLQKGIPSRIHIASIIATDSGINHVRSKLPEGTIFWIGAIDKELTAQAYIVPGLGDAGDLAYGRKD